MLSRLPFIRPSLPTAEQLTEDLEIIEKANWYSNFGPFEQRFREELASYLDVESDRVVSVNNATIGLMGVVAQALPRGDMSSSIAIASFTFAAGAQAVLWHGYRPAWIDIEKDTLQPSLKSFNDLLRFGPVSAILLTNTFGIANPEIILWEEQAAALGIPLIVDSAAGFGSRHADATLLGTSGDYEVFSFHATKPFAIGEGGAVICKNAEDGNRLRSFTNFAFVGSIGSTGIGLNGKLQELNAAIGIRQLSTFEDCLERRRRTLRNYAKAFAGLPMRFPEGLERSSVSFAPLICDSADHARRVLSALHAADVDARNYYSPALHKQPGFSEYATQVPLMRTLDISARSVSLPVLPDMTDDEIGRVIETVSNATSA